MVGVYVVEGEKQECILRLSECGRTRSRGIVFVSGEICRGWWVESEISGDHESLGHEMEMCRWVRELSWRVMKR